jgi:hypothetical protein
MDFRIDFTTEKLGGSLIDDFNPGIGLDLVHEVRELIEEPLLEENQVQLKMNACRIINGYLTCYIHNKKLINTAPQFRTVHNATVFVKPGFFGRFMFMKTHIIYESPPKNIVLKWFKWFKRSKKINYVNVSYDVNWDAVCNQWAADGHPSYWGITEVEYTKKVKKIETKAKEKEELIAKEKEKKSIKQRKMNFIYEDLLKLGQHLTPNELEEVILYVKEKYNIW